MRKPLLLLLLIVCGAAPAAAQDNDSRFEFFAGYSLLRADTEELDEPLNDFGNLNGFNVAATGYLTKRFGVTGDVSVQSQSKIENFRGGDASVQARAFNYLGGPQVKFRNGTRATPFVRMLAGVTNNRLDIVSMGENEPISITDFALAIGSGLDVRVSDHIALRLFQIDYNPVFVRSRTVNGVDIDGQRLDNIRFSVGIVFK